MQIRGTWLAGLAVFVFMSVMSATARAEYYCTTVRLNGITSSFCTSSADGCAHAVEYYTRQGGTAGRCVQQAFAFCWAYHGEGDEVSAGCSATMAHCRVDERAYLRRTHRTQSDLEFQPCQRMSDAESSADAGGAAPSPERVSAVIFQASTPSRARSTVAHRRGDRSASVNAIARLPASRRRSTST